MTNEIKEITIKINELAKAVIPKDSLNSFLQLPLKERVFGIKFFATIGKDSKIIELCQYAESIIDH